MVALNKEDEGRITYIHMLMGVEDDEGTSMDAYKTIATMYLKLQDGKARKPIYTATQDSTAIGNHTACVKLSDSRGNPISYTALQPEVELRLQVSEVHQTLPDGTYPITITFEYASGETKVENREITINQYEGSVALPLPNDFNENLRVHTAITGYYLASFEIAPPTSYTDIVENLKAYAGEVSGDGIIDTTDYEVFYEKLGTIPTDSPYDYNQDQIYDIRDMYYISINDGKGGDE